MMRIIAGTHARTNLIAPKDLRTRPISDRVKEALFNILQFRIAGARVADLFCGTGSLGLEALSRAAEHVLMVDADADAVSRLQQNITKCGFNDRATILRADVFKLAATNSLLTSCDLIFIDPPYPLTRDTARNSKLGKCLIDLSHNTQENVFIVVRHEKRTTLLEAYQDLRVVDRRDYGSMSLTFLEKADGQTDI